ncbi:MAG TPA: AmmeMemoRadiSam system protein B [Sphaerochaeta sp.]|jgi:AmmeMemoRadiSam system protein B|nr:AmmeMemoRadiSam system protein B [Spirochaetota bacterium]NLV61109.1 AmmeMemoRadiSam system protein B [Spirochaetales bacterium]HOE84560.1 AmmeMemoRadiSam system protein B [Sphaerochaeta sp.]HOQ93903.1 AmmeMemoRadiSam system protein B [Sphaerochaeta sp.]HPK46241.1 AmmeMemoRadiSam system protein B [Sphaerochaeta sp.]
MIRTAYYAGSWYPSDPHALKSLVEDSIAQATHFDGAYRFAVLPHAGLFYSKDGIAPFFASDFSAVRRVVIISPSHYTNLGSNVLASAPLGGCETPLGTLKSENFSFADPRSFSAVQSEHALEMVLPYIATLSDPPAVSLALFSHVSDAPHAHTMAKRLISELGETALREGHTVVVASSDFTHYGPRFGYTPYRSQAHQRVKEDDLALSTMLSEGKIEEAYAFCVSHHSTVCGCSISMVVASMALQIGAKGKVASYYTSTDITHSPDPNFVAYSTILWS